MHQRDNDRLLETLKHLRDLGNTLIVVEHDEDTMRAADWIVGHRSGRRRPRRQRDLQRYSAEDRAVQGFHHGTVSQRPTPHSRPSGRRPGSGKLLTVLGASEHNLKNVDVSFRLGAFNCVTGVSGSGKSSLVNEIVYKRLAAELNGARTHAGAHRDMEGIDALDKVIDIDQVAHRADTPFQPGHVYGRVQRHLGTLRLHRRCQNARFWLRAWFPSI